MWTRAHLRDSEAPGGNAGDGPSRWPRLRPFLSLLAFSFGVRALLLIALGSHLPVGFDEIGYLQRAIAWQEILDGPGDLHIPDQALRDRAYGLGRWPPLHTFWMGLALVLAGGNLAAARWAVLLLSALTTPVVYGLGRELGPPRAATAAALLHALYPAFLAYSHLLWSESTFLLLLLISVWAALRSLRSTDGKVTTACALAAGFTMGLALLTRAAGLGMAIALPAWLALLGKRWRAATLCALTTLAVIAPWQLHLMAREGRGVLLSSQGGYNLLLGNNPWVPDGLGSSWAHPESKQQLEAAMEQEAERQSLGLDQAARALAMAEIRARPLAAASRALERLRMLWTPEVFPLRHLLHGLYPPTSPGKARILLAASTLTYLLLLTLVARGWRDTRPLGRSLILTLVVAGCIPSLMTIGMSRLHLPMLALLLPIAGVGATRPWGDRPWKWQPWALLGAFLLLTLPAWPLAANYYLRSSSHYAPLLTRIDSLLGQETLLNDRIELRRFDDFDETVRVRLLSPGSFADGSKRQAWKEGVRRRELIVWSPPGARLELVLSTKDRRWRLDPIVPEAWQRWQATEHPGIAWRWGGGEIDPRWGRWPDEEPPGPVLGLRSPSHAAPSRELDIVLEWSGAADLEQDAVAYSVALDRSAIGVCPTGKASPGRSRRFPDRVEGRWFAHACAVDKDGRWGPVTTAGPFVIDRSSPKIIDHELLRDGRAAQLRLQLSEPTFGTEHQKAFRLLAAGEDGKLETRNCSRRTEGDDLGMGWPKAAASSDLRTLTLTLGELPEEGLLRLIPCAQRGLKDAVGHPMHPGESIDFRVRKGS